MNESGVAGAFSKVSHESRKTPSFGSCLGGCEDQVAVYMVCGLGEVPEGSSIWFI